MEEAVAATREQQVALTRAFEAACRDLGIGAGSMDVWRKERLAGILETLAITEDADWHSLAGKAVTAFLTETSVPAASPAENGGDASASSQCRLRPDDR
jgi:hypothetical protein